MHMALWEIISLVFFALSAAAAGRDAIPILVFVWKPGSMRLAFDDPGVVREWISRSAALGEGTDRLKELGFSLLGIKNEKLPLWGPVIREVAFVSRAADTYASIVLRPNADPASVYFFSPFRSGGMVFTRNRLYGTEVEGERLSVKNVPSADLREVFDSHAGRLRVFLDRGFAPNVGSSQQARIDATSEFYASEFSRRYGKYLWSPSIMGFLISSAVVAAILIRYGLSLLGIR
jgi:hypothetical protein